MTSDVILMPEEAVVEDAVPTTQHATLHLSVITVEDPTHTKEDDPGVLLTTLRVINAELLDTTLISVEEAPPIAQQHVTAVEFAVEDDTTYTTLSMETDSLLKCRCRSKLQSRANSTKHTHSRE